MILFLSMILSISTVQAAQWTCAPEAWSQAPTLENGRFTGALSSTCTIKDTKGEGLAALQKRLVEKTMLGTMHSAPVEESLFGLPSTRYDVTEPLTKDASIRVRGYIEIATDRATRLYYLGASTGVEASGIAGYLKVLNLMLEVRQDNPTTYSASLTTEFAIERPWYAPNGVFMSQARKTATDKFKRAQHFVLDDAANHL